MYYSYHRIIGARWTPKVNMLKIRCGRCDAIFEHRADRWTVRCPSCGKQGGLGKIRHNWVHYEQGAKIRRVNSRPVSVPCGNLRKEG